MDTSLTNESFLASSTAFLKLFVRYAKSLMPTTDTEILELFNLAKKELKRRAQADREILTSKKFNF